MYSDWRNVLGDFLSYVGDQRLEDGLREAVDATIVQERFHHDYVTALQVGIESAARGEKDVIRFLWPMMLISDCGEAKTYLEEVLSKYQTLYEEAMKVKAMRTRTGGEGTDE